MLAKLKNKGLLWKQVFAQRIHGPCGEGHVEGCVVFFGDEVVVFAWFVGRSVVKCSVGLGVELRKQRSA